MSCDHRFIVSVWEQTSGRLGSRSAATQYVCARCLKTDAQVKNESNEKNTKVAGKSSRSKNDLHMSGQEVKAD